VYYADIEVLLPYTLHRLPGPQVILAYELRKCFLLASTAAYMRSSPQSASEALWYSGENKTMFSLIFKTWMLLF
jgi:hypothetical protein